MTTVSYEWHAAEEPSAAVVTAVAAATNRDPVDLPPLYDHVDADALDALLTGGRRSDDEVTVRFDYDGFGVTVVSDGRLTVTPAAHEGR